ncbi:hypothetical protein DFR75_1011526 [Nocardia ignorata]|uniref:Uncharacterized protein n=1 Tax=Nocardia ignorata TaxID=145285 RepID=A0A4R6PU53_NOCIG|nr:hypothetical protein DFR75_1011526 [Nocardia ignorata]
MNTLPVTPAVAPSNPVEALLLYLGYLICSLTNPGGCAVIQ